MICPDMLVTTACVDRAHDVLNRNLFMMKGFYYPDVFHALFFNGFAVLYNFIPYQCRAKNAGRCGVQAEGGELPDKDWFFSLQIFSSGG